MQFIAIVGAGELGGALARQVCAADFAARVVLIDDAGSVAAGKALDIRQAAPVDGYHTAIVGSTDDGAAINADAIVIADRVATGSEWQDDGGVALVRRLSHASPAALFLCAGARQMEVVERAVGEGGLDWRRVIGSAPEALRSAVISFTTLEAGCAPGEVSLTVLGRPPGQIIVPWDDASIGGRRAIDVLPPPAITRLDARLPRLWPPGPMTLASAATRVLRAAATRSPQAVCAYVAVPSAETYRRRAGMLQVVMHDRRVKAVVPATLTTRDAVRLETALQR